MDVEFSMSMSDVDLIRESLRYSKQRIEDSKETPAEQKRQKVQQIEQLLLQLPKAVGKVRGRSSSDE